MDHGNPSISSLTELINYKKWKKDSLQARVQGKGEESSVHEPNHRKGSKSLETPSVQETQNDFLQTQPDTKANKEQNDTFNPNANKPDPSPEKESSTFSREDLKVEQNVYKPKTQIMYKREKFGTVSRPAKSVRKLSLNYQDEDKPIISKGENRKESNQIRGIEPYETKTFAVKQPEITLSQDCISQKDNPKNNNKEPNVIINPNTDQTEIPHEKDSSNLSKYELNDADKIEDNSQMREDENQDKTNDEGISLSQPKEPQIGPNQSRSDLAKGDSDVDFENSPNKKIPNSSAQLLPPLYEVENESTQSTCTSFQGLLRKGSTTGRSSPQNLKTSLEQQDVIYKQIFHAAQKESEAESNAAAESSTSRKSSSTASGSSGMNSKTESFQHLFEQNQSESPNDINNIKVLDLGSDLEKIAIDSDFERERSRKIRKLTSAGSCSKCKSVTIPVLYTESSTSRKSSLTASGSSGMNSKTESFQHLFEQNQSDVIDSDFERERLRNIIRLTPEPAKLDASELHEVEEMNIKPPKKMPKLKVVSLTLLAGSLVGSAVILILFSIVKFLINV